MFHWQRIIFSWTQNKQSFVSPRWTALSVCLPLSLLNPYIPANRVTYPFLLTKSHSCILRGSFKHSKKAIAQRSSLVPGARISSTFPSTRIDGDPRISFSKRERGRNPAVFLLLGALRTAGTGSCCRISPCFEY